MADNRQEYGCRWFRAANGGVAQPVPEEHIVASAASFDITGGASNVGLGPGDIVAMATTGGVSLCPGAETTPGLAYGVVVGVAPYWDGTMMVRGRVLPSDTTYGTNLSRQSKVYVVPIADGIWEMDCDDKVTATTLAGYQAFIGENVDFIHDLTSTNTRPTPRIDISGHDPTTATLALRIVGISPTVHNQDFSGNYVKLLVRANEGLSPLFSGTGI